MRSRVALGLLGVALAAYGVLLLLTRQGWPGARDTAAWLVGGVLLHDLVLAPLVLGAWAVLARVLPDVARAPAAVGLVVLGSVTLLAVPVLGRFGARADNATLLDRDYVSGWLVLAGLVLLGVAAGTAWRVRRRTAGSRGGADGQGARR